MIDYTRYSLHFDPKGRCKATNLDDPKWNHGTPVHVYIDDDSPIQCSDDLESAKDGIWDIYLMSAYQMPVEIVSAPNRYKAMKQYIDQNIPALDPDTTPVILGKIDLT
jgi:hypothetical protein